MAMRPWAALFKFSPAWEPLADPPPAAPAPPPSWYMPTGGPTELRGLSGPPLAGPPRFSRWWLPAGDCVPWLGPALALAPPASPDVEGAAPEVVCGPGPACCPGSRLERPRGVGDRDAGDPLLPKLLPLVSSTVTVDPGSPVWDRSWRVTLHCSRER